MGLPENWEARFRFCLLAFPQANTARHTGKRPHPILGGPGGGRRKRRMFQDPVKRTEAELADAIQAQETALAQVTPPPVDPGTPPADPPGDPAPQSP